MEPLTDNKFEDLGIRFHHYMLHTEKMNEIMCEQSILIASAARRKKGLSSDWEDYINEELEIISENQIIEMLGNSPKVVNFTALFKDKEMKLNIDDNNDYFDAMVHGAQTKGIIIDDDDSDTLKLLTRKDAGLTVDDNCQNRYGLSYQDLKNYWKHYDVTKAKGGICTKTEYSMPCQCIFDYKHNNDMVKRYSKFKDMITIKNWDLYHKKEFGLGLRSPWFLHCGNACIWSGQYVGTIEHGHALYEIKINGGYKYNCSINKIYNIDDIVLVIVDKIVLIDKGGLFQTDHLDEIENKIQDLLKNMPYIQFRLKNMNKDNVDGIKLILSNAMIKRNQMHCNYNQCLKSVTNEKKILCSGCRSIYYCSKKCQKLDWKAHRCRCFRNRLSTERHLLKNKTYLFDWA